MKDGRDCVHAEDAPQAAEQPVCHLNLRLNFEQLFFNPILLKDANGANQSTA